MFCKKKEFFLTNSNICSIMFTKQTFVLQLLIYINTGEINLRKEKKSFIMYTDYWQWFKLLSDAELGHLTRAVFDYERNGILPQDLDEKESIAFAMVKENLDRDKIKYEATCLRNQQIAKARWKKLKESGVASIPFDTDGTDPIRLFTKDTDNDNDNDIDNDNDSDIDNDTGKNSKKF